MKFCEKMKKNVNNELGFVLARKPKKYILREN